MISKSSMSYDKITFFYIIVVLLTTWLFSFIIFSNNTIGLSLFELVMFFPAIIALIFNIIQGKSRTMFSCVTAKPNLKSMIFGIGYPLLFIATCSIIALLTGLGVINTASLGGSNFLTILITTIILILINLIPAFGEEYGWRGYLLPRLTKSFGKTVATIIVGVVWGLFHFPVVYLLAKITGIGDPLLVATIQALTVFMFSFSYSYSFYLSKNLIPVLFFHSTWNVVNVLILGDIYTKKAGIIVGNLSVINGEGLLGVILGGILAIWFIIQFRKSDKYSNKI
ncbi:MAG: lysostaphin resistance A-like protein [Methanobacterium sp.]